MCATRFAGLAMHDEGRLLKSSTPGSRIGSILPSRRRSLKSTEGRRTESAKSSPTSMSVPCLIGSRCMHSSSFLRRSLKMPERIGTTISHLSSLAEEA